LRQYQELDTVIKDVAQWDPNNTKWRDSAAVTLLVGEGFGYGEDYETALQSYDRASKLLQKLWETDQSNASLALDLTWVHRDMTDGLTNKNRPQAIVHCNEALSILEKLATIDTTNLELRQELIGMLIRKGNLLRDEGDYDKALTSYQRAADVLHADRSVDPLNISLQETVNWLHTEMERAFSRKGDSEKAIREQELALSAIDAAVRLQPTTAYYHSLKSKTLVALGTSVDTKNDSAGARRLYADAAQSLRQAIRLEPANASFWYDLSVLYRDHLVQSGDDIKLTCLSPTGSG
jgi:tetratricopeptide (TPR) repeat protein